MGDNLPFINLGVGKSAKAIATGYHHTCVLLDDDQVKCFGDNRYEIILLVTLMIVNFPGF